MRGSVELAHVVRSGWVESVHAGHAALVDPDGAVVRAWGRPEDPILPRSSNKPLQATGMVAAGLDLDARGLAIAAASHSGESFHLDTVLAVLLGGGLGEADLANTPDLPYDRDTMVAWLAAGRGPTALAQNCSGKHAAMLRTAQVLGSPTVGYLDPAHPVQRAAVAGVEALTGERVAHTGVDGCGAPVVAVSLVGLARAMSRMVQAGAGTAPARVAGAMAAHPELVGGTGRDVTAFIRGVPGAIAKDGAEGVHVLALPDGCAAALKVADGSARARQAVACALMTHLEVDPQVVTACAPPAVLGAGRPVGHVRATI